VALKKSIPQKWKNEIPPSTSPKWNIIWHKAKAQKEAAFLWMVIHKTMVVNKWRGKSQWKLTNFPSLQPIIGGNRWNIGSTTVFSLNKGGNMLPTSFDNSLPKEGMSVHGYLSPTMQCFLDQPLCKTLKWFSCIWFFLRANVLSIIWRQHNDLQ
jgi:hypothetical protein